ncbi:metacaspase-1 [Pseudogymnoascus sp. 24MN13]|nr:metacaspase-1 [Pseudogymnoascus sp. 24MN13]
MSGYPGAGYSGGGGYGPPQQQYPPQQHYQSQPQYGRDGAPEPRQQYGGGYQQGPPPQQHYGGGYQQQQQVNRKLLMMVGDLRDEADEIYSPRLNSMADTTVCPRTVPTMADQVSQRGNNNAYVHGNHQAPAPPPSAPQGFGSGAPQDYNFQYSNCADRREALLIGINYFGQRGQLRGCINDVKNMSSYLFENFGYKREDMVILTDDLQNPMSQPTKQNILRAMHWLVKDARPNDALFFHYSGMSGYLSDGFSDTEAKPKTSTATNPGDVAVIDHVDIRQVGHIVDDEMHRIMVTPLSPGVRLTAIFDSCHSGTALDLPYIYSTQGILKEPNLAKEAGQGLLSVISSYSRGDMGGVASNVMGFLKKATSGDEAYNRTVATKTSPADVVMWSGSKDDQTSADASIASQATGAMSWAFITAMKKNPQQSYVQLLNSIRDELATKYTQKPQLSCSHPLNTNLLFVM